MPATLNHPGKHGRWSCNPSSLEARERVTPPGSCSSGLGLGLIQRCLALELVQGLAALRLPERPTVGAGSGDGGRLTRFLRSPAQEKGTDKRRKFGFLGMTKYATGLTGGKTTHEQRRWGPTSFGRLLTSTADWSLSQDSQTFILEVAGVRRLAGELSASDFKVRRGVLWSTVDVALPSDRVLLDGIPNESAAAMLAALEAAQMHRAFLLRCDQAFTSAAQWAKNTEVAISEQLRTRGWLTQTFKAERNSAKPRELMALLQDDVALQHLAQQPAAVQQAVAYWHRSFEQVADEVNEQHLKRERHDSREFFERVEKSPLTAEQVDAVVCFDSRLLPVCILVATGQSQRQRVAAHDRQQHHVELLALKSIDGADAKPLGTARVGRMLWPHSPAGVTPLGQTHSLHGLEYRVALRGVERNDTHTCFFWQRLQQSKHLCSDAVRLGLAATAGAAALVAASRCRHVQPRAHRISITGHRQGEILRLAAGMHSTEASGLVEVPADKIAQPGVASENGK